MKLTLLAACHLFFEGREKKLLRKEETGSTYNAFAEALWVAMRRDIRSIPYVGNLTCGIHGCLVSCPRRADMDVYAMPAKR